MSEPYGEGAIIPISAENVSYEDRREAVECHSDSWEIAGLVGQLSPRETLAEHTWRWRPAQWAWGHPVQTSRRSLSCTGMGLFLNTNISFLEITVVMGKRRD